MFTAPPGYKPQTLSRWFDTTGTRVEGGTWMPPFFAYVRGEPAADSGHVTQWLVVGPSPTAVFGSKEIALEAVPEGCRISGLEGLKGPCFARTKHKVYTS